MEIIVRVKSNDERYIRLNNIHIKGEIAFYYEGEIDEDKFFMPKGGIPFLTTREYETPEGVIDYERDYYDDEYKYCYHKFILDKEKSEECICYGSELTNGECIECGFDATEADIY